MGQVAPEVESMQARDFAVLGSGGHGAYTEPDVPRGEKGGVLGPLFPGVGERKERGKGEEGKEGDRRGGRKFQQSKAYK